MPEPELIRSVLFNYVRFPAHLGKPQAMTGDAQLVLQDRGDDRALVLKFNPGVTGHESYYVEDLRRDKEKYFMSGIWPCVGTRGRWAAMYVHAWEFERLWGGLGLDDAGWIDSLLCGEEE